jgi:hypothetical protein
MAVMCRSKAVALQFVITASGVQGGDDLFAWQKASHSGLESDI